MYIIALSDKFIRRGIIDRSVYAIDDPLYRLPDAGGSGFTYLPLAMLFMAALITIIFTKRKENCK